MSDEKRREELKAKINEQLDKLSIEDLESVAGGIIIKNDDGTYTVYDKRWVIQGGVNCPECGRHFDSYSELDEHMENCHSGNQYYK
jgi:hypothetical protein